MRSHSRLILVFVLAPALAFAQVPNDVVIMRGLDFERQGRFEDAVAAFRQVLAREPANAQALLGAERAYAQLGRRDSTLALATRAVAADPQGTLAWTVEVRSARALGGEAMAAEVLGRWMTASPGSESPYRELVRLLIATGRLDDAREAVMSARAHLGDPERLHPELAAVEAAAGNWSRAAGEWRAAVKADNDVAGSASFNLMSAPLAQHERVIHALTDPDSAAAPRRVAAELLLGWNDPERAWATLQTAIPTDAATRRSVLQSFADRARASDGRASQRAAAQALEFMAAGLPPAEAARARIESARAFSAAGDQAAARRVLRGMADDPATGAEMARSAATTLVELYAKGGNPAEAARLLEQQRARLPGTEAERLGIIVARGWIASGDLDRADAAIAPDSSLAADEVRGWTALYRGNLADARERLREAGPTGRGSDADRSVERATVLALLQAVRADSSRDLGAALLLAARGDTARAALALVALARSPGTLGRPELLATAARYTAVNDPAGAEALWTEVATAHPESAPAPTALLALARLLAARGDSAGATQRLEALILNYPASALVPEARRELDRVRGALPPNS
ncbi:MAG: tetratricopeptide repeat protein [Gemmatimonadales bacterium]